MNGQEILARVIGFLQRYVVLSEAHALAMAVWCLHTWVYERLSRTCAYVEITGVSGSGKTTLMEACGLLSRGSEQFNTLSTKAMCRVIRNAAGQCAFFIDEAERLESNGFGDQRSMLASGYRRGGYHPVTVGEDVIKFPSWCPKMFTSTRTITNVLHNRCIPVWMQAGRPMASLSLEYERAEAQAGNILAAFKTLIGYEQHDIQVGETEEGLPIMRAESSVKMRFQPREADYFRDERDREIWTPLLSLVASLDVDAAMMDRVIAASVDVQSKRGIVRRCDAKVEDQSAKERSYALWLVKDALSVLPETEDRIASKTLVDRLYTLPAGPWRTFQQNGLSEITLAQLLGAVGVSSETIRFSKGTNPPLAKGYYRKAIAAALPEDERAAVVAHGREARAEVKTAAKTRRASVVRKQGRPIKTA